MSNHQGADKEDKYRTDFGWWRLLSDVDLGTVSMDRAMRDAAAWPDKQRLAPWSGLLALIEGRPPPPHWPLVRALTLDSPGLGERTVARMLESGHLEHLSTLGIATHELSWSMVVRVCRMLPSLRSITLDLLQFDDCDVGECTVEDWTFRRPPADWLALFLASPAARSMRSLSIMAPEPRSDSWWRTEALAPLEELHLERCDLPPDALADLLSMATKPVLRALSVRLVPDKRALTPLWRGPWPALARLDVSRNQLTDDDLSGMDVALIAGLEVLDLSYNQIGKPTIELVTQHARRIEQLDVSATAIEDESFAAAISSLQRLPSTLRVVNTGFSSRAWATLLEHPTSGLVRKLDLEGTAIGTREMQCIETLGKLSALEALNLRHCQVDGEGFAYLMTSARLPRLRVLELGGCDLGRSVCRVRPNLFELVRLGLNGTFLKTDDSSLLFDPERLPALESLSLEGTLLPPAAARAVAALAAGGKLADLDISHIVYWHDAEFSQVLRAALPHLVLLAAGDNSASEAAIFSVLANTAAPYLRSLRLPATQMEHDEFASLLNNDPFPRLEELEVGYGWMDDETFELLSGSPVLARLRQLTMRGEYHTVEAREALENSIYRRPHTLVEIS